MPKKIYVGTSGYSYKHWKDIFYPKDLTQDKWLKFYSEHFKTVELNVTFYRLPFKKTFQNWHKITPKDFKFVIKGSRFITHIKKLTDCKKPLRLFFNNASSLKDKLLCVLWQLPPNLKCDLKRLNTFISLLKKNYSRFSHSFEFRNESWFTKSIYELLNKENINLCIADSPRFPAHEILTSSFIYLRFHGGKILYGSEYSKKELKTWAEKAKRWLKDKETLFVFFNNDAYGFAVKNALRFNKLITK